MLVERVRSSHIPATWRIVRPRGAYPVRAALRALILSLVGIFFVSAMLLLFGVVGSFIANAFTNNPSSPPWRSVLIDL
jgi:hypothetical protein